MFDEVAFKFHIQFSWQVQYSVQFNCHFSWQVQYLVKSGMKAGAFFSIQNVRGERQKVTSVVGRIAD